MLCFISSVLWVDNSYGQQAEDTVTTATPADSILDGIKFIYRTHSDEVELPDAVDKGRLYSIPNNNDKVVTEWDSADTYRMQRRINGIDVSVPHIQDFEEYARVQRQRQERELRQQMIEEGRKEEQEQSGLLDFSIQVPGGESSVFSTIFGKPEVNLRVNGSANMNVGASIQNIENPQLDEDMQRRIDPLFNQNLQLNIQGTIGDKLTIATDWDTERAFDFQNRLSIVYEGYEDEIIKRIEMGNVSMETGNSLISGGASLFGIKSVAEMGNLRLTSVVSQQKGETETQKITGGSEETPISIRPVEYQDNRHFFIDFFNRQEFENNLSNPQTISQAYQITDLRVWISEPQINTTDAEAIRAAAFVDLGVVEQGEGFSLPHPGRDNIDDQLLEDNRSNTSASADDFGVSGNDFYNGYFRPLRQGADYTVNEGLGIISLNRNLSSGSYIAVSFVRAPVPGESENAIEVGDISSSSSGLTYLKLLRTNNPTPEQKAWPLTLRNVYSLGVADLTPDGTEVEINFTQGNIESNSLEGRDDPLLQELGLDRTNTQGSVTPDNQIDFNGITLNAANGTIMFPYLEPFGNRISELLEDAGLSDSVVQALSYNELYTEKQSTAGLSEKNNYYRIDGFSKGGVSGNFTLGFSLVEGSVKVYANGSELTEGVDYEVDYSFGSITILNEKYLAAGQEISIEYENNQMNAIGQKNFTGLRAEYRLTEDISIGGTYFKLKEQPLSDKIRIGNEAINNTVLGMDANARFDAPWLTRAIDHVPLLQTKEPSNFNFSGEFAQLRPDVAQTNAVQQAIDNGELYKDEENGLSFIDDFEGSEISISLTSATRWNLAAAPAAIPGYEPDQSYFNDPAVSPDPSLEAQIARSDLRSQFSWYTIPRNVSDILGGVERTPESKVVRTQDVFPGRETGTAEEDVINTLDVFYNPQQRGPYNYNRNLKDNLENNPGNQWGGMTLALPSGQEDLTQNNIEFLEFWVQPVLPNGEPARDISDYDGKIYIDIGTISEDVVPNSELNSEDGLANNIENLVDDNFGDNVRSRIPASRPAPQGQFSNNNRNLEDVGFDGVPNADGYNQNEVETYLFRDFIDAMREDYGEDSEEFQRILADPSNDDYVYYGESQVSELPLQERFYRMLGYHEGNTPLSGGDKRAVTNRPDTEGLMSRSTVQTNNNYFQYELDINPADEANLEIGSEGTYIVDKVSGSLQEDRWHLVRIPLAEFERKIGEIESFQNITHIRMWMSGYEKPFTLRFATFKFVGSQWRKVEDNSDTENATGEFRVSTINIEENSNRSPVPYRQPEGSIRAQNRGLQVNTLANEQSLALEVENLGPQEMQMVKRVYPGGLDLLNYRHMRMFVHGEGFENRGDAELVIRMGTDLESNYYEYRQPVTPSRPDDEFTYSTYSPDGGGDLLTDAQEVWQYEENSMNLILSAFNEIKQIRDQQDNAEISERFERPLQRDGEQTAPGAVVVIKGNPSLGRINEIGMGIQNPYDPNDVNTDGQPNLNAQFWLNELRLSGFDNEKGWRANAKANVKFADFATVNTNFSRSTTGFGSLNSGLGGRSKSDDIGYDINTTVNLHKFVPDRFGWNFPVSISTRKNISTPKYLPDQGDIRLNEFINATNNNDQLSEQQKQMIIDEKLDEVETVTDNFSLNVSNISKQNSKSKLAQYTLDNTRLSYVYNQGSRKNPKYLFQDNWSFNTSLQYNLSFNNVKVFRPLTFLENVPVAGVFSDLGIGYMPSSISASASMNRSYEEQRRRPTINEDGEEEFQSLQQKHSFNQRNSFSLNYNLTPSIPISFRTNTDFNLTEAGQEQRNKTGLDVDSSSYSLTPTFEVLENLISDTLSARRSTYTENYTASWRPPLNKINGLSWLSYSASYGGGFRWQNSDRGSRMGANVSNTFRLDHTLQIAAGELLDGVGLIQNMRDADEEATMARQEAKKADEPVQPDLFKDAQYYGRKLLLAATGITNIDIGYKSNKTSNQSGYEGDSQFYYAFSSQGDGNFSPPFLYRIGIDEELPRNQLIQQSPAGQTVLLPKVNNYSDNITLSTRINLFDNLSVDLDWSTRWDENNRDKISLDPTGSFSSSISSSGNISSSVWAFGQGYGDLFKRQINTAFADIDFNGEDLVIDDRTTGNNDGRTVLNRNTLEEDFRKSYLGSNTGAVGEKGYTPFPKPNWRVTWSGVENLIPIIGDNMQRATLSHRYSGSYRIGWNLNSITGQQSPEGLGDYSVIYYKEKYEPTTINIDRSFSPLLQLNVTWQSDLKTQIGYNQSKTTSLAMSSRTVSERVTKGVNVSLNYTFRKIRLPFLPNVTNNVDLTINGSYADDADKKFFLSRDVDQVLSDGVNIVPDAGQYDFNDPELSGQRRINASLVLGYRFSQTVTSNFEYTYTQVDPKSSAYYPRRNHEIRFNFRIAIQSR